MNLQMFFIWIFPFKPPFVDDLSISAWWFGTFTIFPFSWEYIIIPTDELHHFSEGGLNHQPGDFIMMFPAINQSARVSRT
jgi:hypothetical protein